MDAVFGDHMGTRDEESKEAIRREFTGDKRGQSQERDEKFRGSDSLVEAV